MTRSWSLAMQRFSIEPRARKYVRGYRFLSFARKYKRTYWILLLDTGLNSLKTASKKVVHKAGESLGNKIADAKTKSNNNKNYKQEPAQEIIIPPEKREEILNELR